MSVETFSKEDFERRALPRLKTDPSQPAWTCKGLIQGEWTYLVPLGNDKNGNPRPAMIEVRSSVRDSGWSASTGKDSIRAWITGIDGRPLGSKIQKYVTRVPGWDTRTLEMLRKLATLAVKIRVCPECQTNLLKPFIVRKEGPNHGRPFLSCECKKYFEWLDTEEE